MERKQLRIIKKLPQIILPANKNELFLNWYDEDLRFQDEIPKAFEKGYVFIENNFLDIRKINLSLIAKKLKTTYRIIENMFNEFVETIKKVTVYFEFKDNFLNLEIYNSNSILLSTLNLDLTQTDNTKPNLPVLEKVQELVETSDFTNCFSYYCFILIECCLWYMATATKTTKYYREGKRESFYYEEKTVINPKKNKTISTPIYDMSKIRRIKTEGLIKRRKGWTYSHSFKVHGHYRHYANGKVIFIEPFIKGKGKEEINQTIVLNPSI